MHARELTAVRHFADADAAQAELAVDRVRATATLAAGVGADFELRTFAPIGMPSRSLNSAIDLLALRISGFAGDQLEVLAFDDPPVTPEILAGLDSFG